MLSWYESHAEAEVPPENIWEDGEGLEQWWKQIDERRSEGSPVGDDEEDEDDPRMLNNELSRELRK